MQPLGNGLVHGERQGRKTQGLLQEEGVKRKKTTTGRGCGRGRGDERIRSIVHSVLSPIVRCTRSQGFFQDTITGCVE
ncbi:hypothetical protein E2320_012602 [Naja naja]|nr:hypothetical protein E2320_012602 [Naja naja]